MENLNRQRARRNRWVRVRSKNETANQLRRAIPTNGKNVILRLGSKTPTNQITTLPVDIELNTPEACILSNNKIRMKTAFDENEVKTAVWAIVKEEMIRGNDDVPEWTHFPAIIKHKNSSRGQGLTYIEDQADLYDFIQENLRPGGVGNFIIEKYHTYVKEYRLHVTKDGCFYACRKMLKRDAEERWHRHDNNSVWILPENEAFDKPDNWDDIVVECVKAMNSVGLDICAVDVKVQNRENPEFIILETNSGPSLGGIGAEKYKEEISRIIRE